MLKKMRISYNITKKIKEEAKNILDEVTTILKQENGYKYDTNIDKIKNIFPTNLNMKYDKHNIFIIKEESKNRKVSFSLNSNNITHQLDSYLQTAIRRYNSIYMFNYNAKIDSDLHLQYIHNIQIISILDFRYNLRKYDQEKIKIRLPYFCDEDNIPLYDVIYSIKNENLDKESFSNNKTTCNNILICCNKKRFNIMIETNKESSYYDNFKYKINEISIKELF